MPDSPSPNQGNSQASNANSRDIQDNIREAEVIEVLRTIYDPEIPVNIYDLGLIYDIATKPDQTVDIKMTLTSPNCPVAGSLPPAVADRVRNLDTVEDCSVEVVWDPPWSPDRMTEAAKLQLGML